MDTLNAVSGRFMMMRPLQQAVTVYCVWMAAWTVAEYAAVQLCGNSLSGITGKVCGSCCQRDNPECGEDRTKEERL